jgi:hypothetical protein
MSFFAKKSPISTELIFDIESDSVCATIFLYEANKAPRIVYNNSIAVARKANTASVYLTRNMLKTLEDVASTTSAAMLALVEKKLIRQAHVDRIHIVLSSPWIISKLSCVKETFKKEVSIRQSTVAALLEKEKSASAKLFAVGDAAAIDTKLFEIKINGYPVADYEGKHALSLEGTMVISFASRKMLNEIKSRINRFFRAHDETFHSALILRYVALRSVMSHHTDYVWLQIHGELTDVLVVREGACAISGSLPFGLDTLVRKFASATNESQATAASLLEFLDNSSNTVLILEKTRSTLGKIMPEWTREIVSLMSSGGESMQASIAYVSAEHFSSAFEQAVKQFSPTTSVMRADTVIVTPFIEYAPSVLADLSASLYAAALPLSRKL